MSQNTPSRPQQQGAEHRASSGIKSASSQGTPVPLSSEESSRNASQTSLVFNPSHPEGQHHLKARAYPRDHQNRRNSLSKHSNYHHHQNNTMGSAQFQGNGAALTEKQHSRGPRYHHQGQNHQTVQQQGSHQGPHQVSHQVPHQGSHHQGGQQGYQSHHPGHHSGHQQQGGYPRFNSHGHSRGASFQANPQVGTMYNPVMTVDGQMYPAMYPSYGDVGFAPGPQQIGSVSPQAPFMGIKPPSQFSRVVMTDANGNPINLQDRLRHNRTHSSTEQDSSKVAKDAPAPKTATAASAATAAPAAPRGEPRSEPPAEFTLPGGPNDVAQKMKELIAAKRQKKLAEAKVVESKAADAKTDEAKPASTSAAEPTPSKANPEQQETKLPTEPKAYVKPAEHNPETKHEAQAEAKAEAKPEVKSEIKPEAKPEVKSEAQTEVKPEALAAAEEKPVQATSSEAKISDSKPTGPKAAMPEPEPKGKWVPPSLRRLAEAQKTKDVQGEASSVADSGVKPEVKETKPEIQPEAKDPAAETKPETISDINSEVKEAKSESEGRLESKFDPKAETKEAKDEDNISKSEKFKTQHASARLLTVDELATFKYPTSVLSNTEVSRGQAFRYSPDFLIQFASRVPRAHYEQFSKILGFEYQSGATKWGSGMGLRGSMGGRGSSRSSHGSFAGPGGRGGRNAGSARGNRINSRRGKGDRSSSRRDFNDHGPSEADLGPLHTVDNAWKPSSLSKETKKAEDDNRLSPEEVQRKVKSLLNKMAWENFDSVAKKIRDIALQSLNEKDAFTLRQIIQLTFDKAIDEPHWSEIYASFFLYLHVGEGAIPQEVVDESDPGKTLRGVPVLRRYLLNMSQQEFEKGWGEISQLSGNVQMLSDEYYHAISLKRRGLGLTQLIGEMLKKGLVSEKLVMGCFGRLAKEEPTEDIVESLSKLIRTVATTMIKQGSGNVIDLAMNTLIKWKNSGDLQNRLRFKILDMEDLARKNWVGLDESNGPKTIAQVHLDALKKEQEAEREKVKSRQGSRRGNDFGRSASGRGRK